MSNDKHGLQVECISERKLKNTYNDGPFNTIKKAKIRL